MVTTQSMVAIAGEIIPAPLAHTPSRTVPSGSSTSSAHILGKRSVVMMAWSKSGPPPGLTAPSRHARSGRHEGGVQLHSYDPGGTDGDLAAGSPSVSAHASCIARATCSPGSPVQALALPLS